MFQPTRDEARRFFIEAWQKHREGLPLSPLESIAADCIGQHPEYHALLEAGEDALGREFTPEAGQENPFLHLGLHLGLIEQIRIDQPPGIREAWAALCQACSDTHAAAHLAIEALAETLWEAQRAQQPPSNAAYLARLQNAAQRPR